MNQDTNTLSAVIERTRLAGRLAVVSMLLSFALTLAVLIAGPMLAWAGLALFNLALFPCALALVFSVVAFVHALFRRRAAEEEEEKLILEKRKSGVESVLDVSEDVRFTAARTLENFERYAPSAVALLCFLLSVPLLLYFRAQDFSTLPDHAVNLAVMSAIAAAFAFFSGVFLAGQSHVEEFRFLRPPGAWLIFSGALFFVAALSSLFIASGRSGWAAPLAQIVLVIDWILTAELLLSFIVEFYRPRGTAQLRPVYESRLLSVFTEPGGIVRNIADSLDYQFGFEISRTGVWLFFRKAVVPAFLVWAFVFWLFTGIAEVAPGEIGIRERFGVVSPEKATLDPGVHLKLPWPFERIVRVPVDIVQEVRLGSKMDANRDSQAILWTDAHSKTQEPFLVAVQEKDSSAQGTFPVSILEVSLPVYYTADHGRAYDYAFHYDGIDQALLAIGQAEATQYFASPDFITAISSGREEVVSELKSRIQKACDRLELGVRIVGIGMHDAHPPVSRSGDKNDPLDVAGAFQNVVCAEEEASSLVSEAEEAATRTVETAKVEAMEILAKARAYEFDAAHVAQADAARFDSQVQAYRAMPSMFLLRTYLDFLENDCGGMRKYVVSDRIEVRNYVLNLEEKPTLDLMDTDFSSMPK